MRLAVMMVEDSKREELLFQRRDGAMASCC
jgi:hypothetical protein